MSTGVQLPQNPKGYFTAEKRRRLLGSLIARAKEERGSFDFLEFTSFCRRLHSYSLYNRALIYLQRPKAEYVAGRRAWERKLNRQVREGETGIAILVPYGNGLSFAMKEVFDVSQTDGPPLPRYVRKPFEAAGRFEGAWLERLHAFVEKLGGEISVEDRASGAAGEISAQSFSVPVGKEGVEARIVDDTRLRIVLNGAHEEPVQLATLVHEIAHFLLGHLGGQARRKVPDRHRVPRAIGELEAESVAHLVCGELGLDAFSERYLALYRPDDAALMSEHLTIAVAGRIARVIQMESDGATARTSPPAAARHRGRPHGLQRQCA